MARSFWFVVTLCVSCLFCGCTSSPKPLEESPRRWVGTVEGTDALVGVAVEEDAVVAYVCGRSTWATQTGWFATTFAEGSTVDALPATSGSGHTLETLRIDATRATGTIRFADGTTGRFAVPRADPRTPAGLYDHTSSEAQAGLIITNDLETAGASTSLSGDDTASRAPVTVTAPVSSLPPGGSVPVSAPNLPSSTVTPVAPGTLSVTGQSPTLVILVHGMAHPADSDPQLVDSPQYSRGEWSVDFLRGLLGAAPGSKAALHTFLGPFADTDYPVVGARFSATLGEASIGSNTAIPANFVSLVPVDIRPASPLDPARLPQPPAVSAFITYRDATGGLVQSGERIANQAYLALRWYEMRFRRTPRLLFVTQSFGGVTGRFVLSMPTNAELAAASVASDGTTLSLENRRRMAYVRDRTMSLVTLGTPHEGSFLADFGVPVQRMLQDAIASLRQGVAPGSPAASFGASLRVLAELFPELAGASIATADALRTTRAALEDLERRVNGRALRDLEHAFWERVNRGPLHPSRARRAASPIVGASKRLIPVYAGGSRSPGGRAFTAPELSAFDRFASESEAERRWIVMTMGSDTFIRLVQARGFGSSTTVELQGFDARLDRRRRIADFGAYAREKAQTVASSVSPWLVQSARARDTLDAVVTLAIGPAGGLSIPIYLDREGRFDLGGRVRAPALGFQCTDQGRTFRFVLDFGRLLTALVDTYAGLDAARAAVVAKDLNALLSAVSLTTSNVDDVKDWFVRKYASLQATGRCELPSANIASLLTLANLPNWQLVEASDEFPAPRWVRTDEVASDDEIDTDGPVAFDSAMGLRLGTSTPLFFDHTRMDDTVGGSPALGSWYRFFDSPIEPDCHGMQHQFLAGQWIASTLVPAGPIPRANGLGTF